MQVDTALLFETPEQIFSRVFKQIRNVTEGPEIRVEFRRFANANSSIKLAGWSLHVRITDVLQAAPAPIVEALAFILIHKLLRKPVPAVYRERYKRYFRRTDTREVVASLRQTLGRKVIGAPQGQQYDLLQIFDAVNFQYFHGLMPQPRIGWSRAISRRILGHYDPVHHAIVLSRILDQKSVPRVVVEYVMFHEMLHIKFPVRDQGARRCIHTPEFKSAEQTFARLAEAKALLKAIPLDHLRMK